MTQKDAESKFIELIEFDKAHRNEAWKDSFIKLLPEIKFIFNQNPEYLAYVNEQACLLVYGPGNEDMLSDEEQMLEVDFDTLCEIALGNELGVILNPDEEGRSDWILRYGDIESYVFTGNLYRENIPFGYDGENDSSEENTTELDLSHVLTLLPANDFLSDITVHNIFGYIDRVGFEDVSIAIKKSDEPGSDKPELITTLSAENFEDEESALAFVNNLTWYMPEHIGVILCQGQEAELFAKIHSISHQSVGDRVEITVNSGMSAHFEQQDGASKKGTQWMVVLKRGQEDDQTFQVRTYDEHTKDIDQDEIISAIQNYVFDEFSKAEESALSLDNEEILILPKEYL